MADESDATGGNGSQPAAEGMAAGGAAHVSILAQYIRDVSFENPAAPFPSGAPDSQPRIDIGVDVQARRRTDDTFEVDLKLTANAKSDTQQVFLAEIVYGGLFQLRNFPPESVEPFVLIEGPRLLFPFVRRILADLTRDGGFPPLMVEPIDFAQLYRQRLEQQQQQAGQTPKT